MLDAIANLLAAFLEVIGTGFQIGRSPQERIIEAAQREQAARAEALRDKPDDR